MGAIRSRINTLFATGLQISGTRRNATEAAVAWRAERRSSTTTRAAVAAASGCHIRRETRVATSAAGSASSAGSGRAASTAGCAPATLILAAGAAIVQAGVDNIRQTGFWDIVVEGRVDTRVSAGYTDAHVAAQTS